MNDNAFLTTWRGFGGLPNISAVRFHCSGGPSCPFRNLGKSVVFVSGVAILTSLIFLYFQLRQINKQVKQAEKNQQSVIRQARAGRSIGIALTGTEPSLADAFIKGAFGDEDISLTQQSQFSAVCRATIINGEDTFYQHKDGLLDEASFIGFVLQAFALNGKAFEGTMALSLSSLWTNS